PVDLSPRRTPRRPVLQSFYAIRVRDSGRFGARILGALADTRRLAGASAQVIELGAAHLALAHHGHRVDQRRIDREDALHALAIGDLAHGEGLVQPAALAGDA